MEKEGLKPTESDLTVINAQESVQTNNIDKLPCQSKIGSEILNSISDKWDLHRPLYSNFKKFFR